MLSLAPVRRGSLDRFFEDVFWGLNAPSARERAPQVTVQEDEKTYSVRAEVPGFSHDNLDLSVHGKTLTITGTQEEKGEDGEASVALCQTLTLNDTVDAKDIGAKLKDGVLLITLPKHQEAAARKIKIK